MQRKRGPKRVLDFLKTRAQKEGPDHRKRRRSNVMALAAAQASHGRPGVAANQPGPAYEALRRPGNGIVQEPHEPYDCQRPEEIRYH